MKALLRLYPRSWRRRYGREMEVLLEDVPGEIGVGVDLILGAGAAYASVIRRNRVLSACGSYLHGVVIAVLVQAIGFVGFVFVAETSRSPFTRVQLGSLPLVAYVRSEFFGLLSPESLSLALRFDWLPAALLLGALVGLLVLVVSGPRLVRLPE